ncbi:carbohydrate ABC transporter permease [Paenibacillaceae bacterium]|nr:carbohydrate ABC transporter permease [Paenibacillaceae bacterium]
MNNETVRKRKRQDTGFQLANGLFLGFLAVITLFPFYYVVIVSFTDFKDYMDNPLMLFPKSFNLDAYKFVFLKTNFLIGLKNSVIVTTVGVFYNMLLTVTLAYGLSKKFAGRNLCLNLILLTMFFSGGVIPFYIMVANYFQLVNSIWALILPVGINTFNLLVIKGYFESLPAELEESAKMDGANELLILFRIILPVSTPVIATFSLFYAVDRWNEWFNAMLFLQDRDLYTLQLVLREVVVNLSSMQQQQLEQLSNRTIFNMAVKCATVVITTLPIMLVYPFLQKYFTKGLLVGAIKA